VYYILVPFICQYITAWQLAVLYFMLCHYSCGVTAVVDACGSV